MRYRLYRWGWQALDLVFPPTCGGCGKLGQRWCAECQAGVIRLQPPFCDNCGQELLVGNQCSQCRHSQLACTQIRSWAVFSGPLRNAIHTLKYQRNLGLADVFTDFLLAYLRDLTWLVELVVPVPLGRQRLQERGYNQAALLARALALSAKLPYSDHSLQRRRETQSQVGLSPQERKMNVQGAFEVRTQPVDGKSILLVDDVMTSGATLNACAEALLASGASKVYGLTLARAVLSADRCNG